MATKVWLNGNLVDEASAHVSIKDFGLLHAAGAFTTMRAANGRVLRLDAHLARLRDSCDTLAVPLPYSDDALRDAAINLLAAGDLKDARLRLTVTRGEQHVSPQGDPLLKPNVFLTATSAEPYPAGLYANGMTVLAYDEIKLNPYDPQAGHKTLNYYSRFAALREAQRRGANEALLFNVHNFLQSSAMANVFLVKDGTLHTPPTMIDLRDETIRAATPYPKSNVLPGTTRGAIIELARREAIDLRIRGLTVNDVLAADEIFLTNSIMNVMPICRVERKPIGDEKPATLTKRMSELLTAGDA